MNGVLGKPVKSNFQSDQSSENKDLLPLFCLLLSAALALLVAGPWGNFPINDDRIYANGVRSILNTGVLSILSSNAFDFIPIYVGVLVCKVVGFSHDALRWTTIGFHFFGIIGLYLSLRELRLKPVDASLIGAVYALNPFIINLTLSFMTDVPALALANWTIFMTIAAMKRKQFSLWLLSMLFLTAAMSVRQTSLVLLPTVFLCALISLKSNKDRLLFLSTLLIPLLSYISLQHWLIEATEFVDGYANFSTWIKNSILSMLCSPLGVVTSIAQGMCYLGLALCPLAPTLTICSIRSKGLRLTVLAAGLVSVLLVAVPLCCQQVRGAFMPYSLNLFLPPILGAYCLIGGVPTWSFDHLKTFTYFSDLAALLAAFCLTISLLKLPSKLDDESINPLLLKVFFVSLLSCTTGGLVIQLGASNLDRYYLSALAPLLLCLAPLWRDLKPLRLRWLSLLFLIGLAAYGSIAALDVMNFSRAQWQAIRALEKRGVPSRRIDGGPSYISEADELRLCYTYTKQKGFPESVRGGKARARFRWWAVVDDSYIIATCPMDGYHEISRIQFFSPLYWKKRNMLTLESDLLKKERGSDQSLTPRTNEML